MLEQETLLIRIIPKSKKIKKSLTNRTRASFIKLFNIPKNIDTAIGMINEGYTDGAVSEVLHCDRTSVIAFKHRMRAKGVIFKKFKNRKSLEMEKKELLKPNPGPAVCNIYDGISPEENINPGKTYAEYLEEYNQRTKRLKAEQMKKAEKIIRNNNKWRKSVGLQTFEEDVDTVSVVL